MYSEEQYQRALTVPKDHPRYQEIRGRVAEYEKTNPRPLPGAFAWGPPLADNGIPTLPGASPGATTLGVPEELDIDPTKDESLPTASKYKAVAKPPEYAPKSLVNSIAAIGTMAPPSVWHEPSTEEFQADMGEVLSARGITPAQYQLYGLAYNEYRDRKWSQAYDKAAAEDRPLRRVAFSDHSGAWNKLRDFVSESSDVAGAFVNGFADAMVPGSVDALMAAGGKESVDAQRSQASRNPTAHFAGEVAGSLNPGSAAARLTAGTEKAAAKYLPGMGGRIGSAVIGGVVGADADLAARSAGQAIGDVTAGGTADNAKQQFVNHILATTGIAGGLSAVGSLGGMGLERYRRNLRSSELGPELGNLEATGGATDMARGIEPTAGIKADLEAARPPVPGEAKLRPQQTSLEMAAERVQKPIAAENVRATSEFRTRAAAENEAAYAANPELREPRQMRQTAEAMRDIVKGRAQPEAREGFLPGNDQGLPGRNVGPLRKEALKAWEPKLVTSQADIDAAVARGAHVVTPEEAERLGYKVSDLKHRPGPEGVPFDAPEIPDEVNPVDVLPRYSKEQLASSAGGQATPEQAAAVRRYTFGKRQDGDQQLIKEYLDQAPVSPLPNVYRGLVLPPEQASELLASKEFTIGDVARGGSVSSDPIVARSFVSRNMNNPSDVGVTLKLEHSSARDIRHLADPQVKVEGEHLLPEDARFEIVSKHKDKSNPGNWIVVAREVPKNGPSRPDSLRDVLGEPDALSPANGRSLGPREGRAARTPEPTPGSDWDNPDQARARFDFMYEGLPEGVGKSGVPDDITPTRVSSGKPIPMPPKSAGAPAGPPEELRSFTSPKAATMPDGEFRVVLEPRSYNANDYEEIITAFDRAAKEGRAGSDVDPAWAQFQRAARADREQFGPEWAELKGKHHDEATQLEQRAGHANLRGDNEYQDMPANDQKAYSAGLVNYGAAGTPAASNAALRDLAENAGVLKDLDNLRGLRAFQALKEKASPELRESAGMGGMFARVGGLGPAVKMRADAAARAMSRGATGERLDVRDLSPDLLKFVRQNAPAAVEGGKPNPFMRHLAIGGGALGLKAASVYDASQGKTAPSKTLTPEEIAFLQKLLDATKATETTTQ